MYKILAKLCAIAAAILLILGVVDKLFVTGSNIFRFMQHESYFIAANPFILFSILLFFVDFASRKNKDKK